MKHQYCWDVEFKRLNPVEYKHIIKMQMAGVCFLFSLVGFFACAVIAIIIQGCAR